MRATGPRIHPPAPTAGGRLPRLGGAAGLLWDPTEFFDRQRRRHGDTFVVDALGHLLFCVFSPDGVRSLYAQPESQASFGLATYTLIKSKVPLSNSSSAGATTRRTSSAARRSRLIWTT
jgi:hypothetical protein